MHQQKVGTLYIRNAGMSLVGWKNDDAIGGHIGTEANPVWHQEHGIAGTSFYFDTVADATFTVTTYAGSNGNYATTQLPFAAKIPEGLIVYRVKQVAAEKNLELELFEGNVLPANTPVILSSETAGSFKLHPTKWQAPIETKLQGTNLPLKASEKSSGMKYYALTIDDDTQELLFRLVENDVEIPGNRALLHPTSWHSSGFYTLLRPTSCGDQGESNSHQEQGFSKVLQPCRTTRQCFLSNWRRNFTRTKDDHSIIFLSLLIKTDPLHRVVGLLFSTQHTHVCWFSTFPHSTI